MVVGVNGLIATGLIIAENMVVTVTQTLTSAEFYINVTNDVLGTERRDNYPKKLDSSNKYDRYLVRVTLIRGLFHRK